jgi:predicted XRE-type DNA-binding protein
MQELNENWLHLIHVCESRNLKLEQVIFTRDPARSAVWKELLRRGLTQTEINRMFNVDQSPPRAKRTANSEEVKDEDWMALIKIMSLKDIASPFYSRGHAASRKRASIMKMAHQAGVAQSKIARAFNVSQQAVSKAVKRK